MKKVIKTMIVLLVAVLTLSGCGMKENVGFTIDKDGNIDLKLIAAFDDEMIDTLITISEHPEYMQAESPDDIKVETHTDAERWAYLESDSMKEELDAPEGYKSEKYDKDGYKGWVYTKTGGKLDDVSKESATERVNISNMADDDGSITSKTLFIKSGDTYKSNMTIDLDTGSAADSFKQVEQYGGKFDMSFIIELPNKPISSNADSSDGNTLKWNLLNKKDIELEFKLTGESGGNEGTSTTGEKDKKSDKKKDKEDDEKSNLVLYIGIGAGVLVLLVIIIAVAASSKKKKAQNEVIQPAVMTPTFGQPMEPPVQPIQPVQPVDPNAVQQPQDPNNMNGQM